MKKILIPTDFSKNAENAAVYALNLFKSEECEFHLLNTFLPSAQYDEHYPWHDELEDSTPQKSKKGLAALSDKLAKKYKSDKHIFFEHSAMNTMIGEIKKTIRKDSIDLVVMGTHGATGAKNKFFGSNTTQAIRKLNTPLLAIPSEFTYKPPKEVLFPTDYEIAYSDKQLAELLHISKCHKSRIRVLHISPQLELSEDQNSNKSTLDGVLSDIDHDFQLVHGENVRDTINEYQLGSTIDFLVMIKNKHTFLERLFSKSEIKQIGLHIKVPFLVTPWN
ncbi:universal stress protein [Aureitalea sp. L0-47]|uniref:universal stress protein n=1 Tax=Aureitalea sp. L0-47 TaxID=2816962 RepID=UPI002238AF84|nr:universal stress protein [Aureitalea sp. L0-47]MCW5518247.1 universal stress protein [Aureitalea sp. L0-47]